MTSAAELYFDPASLLRSHAEAAAAGAASGPLTVAYQGEPGAYSEQALRQLFSNSGLDAQPVPCASFSAVFSAVASGSARYALVPIENSLGGSIHDNYDLLLRHSVTCVAELQFRVSHCLLALPGVKLEDVTVVYSHPQALAQCEEYLSKLGLPGEKQYDTAGSAKMIAEGGLRHVAAIASELAGSTYGLSVLARKVEDDAGNYTRFLLLAPSTTKTEQSMLYSAPGDSSAEADRPRANSLLSTSTGLTFSPALSRTTHKTSLVFTLPDEAGSLFKALSVFALRDIILCKIESRPCKSINFQAEESLQSFQASKAKAASLALQASEESKAASKESRGAAKEFQYLFFVDASSNLSQSDALKNGLRHLKEYAPFLRVLGSYPVFQALSTEVKTDQGQVGVHGRTASTMSGASSPAPAAATGRQPLRIGILGFGTFGQFLARKFLDRGHAVVAHSRSDYAALSANMGVQWAASMSDLAAARLDVLVLSVSILSFAQTVSEFPWALLRNALVVDVLSVKEHPRSVLLGALAQRTDLDILATHPMFGPESGKHSWRGLAFMYDVVRVAPSGRERVEGFLELFRNEGCRMLDMPCGVHDSYAAGSQFLTHTTGRILGALHPVSTPINTAGYTRLLQVVEQTNKDSWELYAGLYKFNARSQEQLELFGRAFDELRARLKATTAGEEPSSAFAASASAPPASAAAPAAGAIAFNPTVVLMNESATAAVADRAKALQGQGVDVTSLAVGEVLSIKTPPEITQAVVEALQRGDTTYTATTGLLALRTAIASKLLRENGLQYAPEQIVVSAGAKQSLFQSLLALVTPSCDEVLIPAPYWVSYTDMTLLAGGRAVVVPTTAQQGYVLQPEQLEKAINARTRALILCSPSNPTGVVYTRAQMEALAAVLRRHPHVMVLSDEIYEHLLFDGAVHTSFASLPGMMDRTLTVNGFSKGYVMTGLRVGYVAAPRPVAAMVAKIQGQITSCCCSLSQHAAIAALTKLPASFQKDLSASLCVTRDLLLAELAKIPGLGFLKPQGAFYVLLDCKQYFGRKTQEGKTIDGSDALCMYLLDSHRVALVPGSAFGAPDCLRISYASSNEIVLKGVKALAQGLAELQQ